MKNAKHDFFARFRENAPNAYKRKGNGGYFSVEIAKL